MSVVVIGDRAVGKTSMKCALAKNQDGCVQFTEEDRNRIKEQYPGYFNDEYQLPRTKSIDENPYTLRVRMRGGERLIQTQWADTPGEAWETLEWREKNLSQWDTICQKVKEYEAIMLLLSPWKGLIGNSIDDEDIRDSQDWTNRVIWWLKTLKEYCNNDQYIMICLNKADLFCDIKDKAREYPNTPTADFWLEYSNEVRQRYFQTVEKEICSFRRPGNPIKFFLTTQDNRTLLELPWMYIAPHLAY